MLFSNRHQIRISGRFERGKPPNSHGRDAPYNTSTTWDTYNRPTSLASARGSFPTDKCYPHLYVPRQKCFEIDSTPPSPISHPVLTCRVELEVLLDDGGGGEERIQETNYTAQESFLQDKYCPVMPLPSGKYIEHVSNGFSRAFQSFAPDIHCTSTRPEYTPRELQDHVHFLPAKTDTSLVQLQPKVQVLIQQKLLDEYTELKPNKQTNCEPIVGTEMYAKCLPAICNEKAILIPATVIVAHTLTLVAYSLIQLFKLDSYRTNISSNPKDCVTKLLCYRHLDHMTESRPTHAKKFDVSGLRSPLLCPPGGIHGFPPQGDEMREYRARVTDATVPEHKQYENQDLILVGLPTPEPGLLSLSCRQITPLIVTAVQQCTRTAKDGDNQKSADKSSAGTSRSSQNATRPSARQPLRRSHTRPFSSTRIGSGNDDDYDDEERHRRVSSDHVGPESKCQAPALLLSSEESDSSSSSETDDDTDSNEETGTGSDDATDNEDAVSDFNISVANAQGVSMLGGLSRVLGGIGRGLISYSFFSDQNADVQHHPDPTFTLNVSIDSPSQGNTTIVSSTRLTSPSFMSDSPEPRMLLQVTPIRNSPRRRRANSEVVRTKAYFKPPAKMLRDRVKLKLDSEIGRKRCNSGPPRFEGSHEAQSNEDKSHEVEDLAGGIKINVAGAKLVADDVPAILENILDEQPQYEEFTGLAKPEISPIPNRRKAVNSLFLTPTRSTRMRNIQPKTPPRKISCNHITEEGLHECNGNPGARSFIHLKENLLGDTDPSEWAMLFTAADKVLLQSHRDMGSPASVNPLNQTITLTWKHDEIVSASRSLEEYNDSVKEIQPSDRLLRLLGRMNRHLHSHPMANGQDELLFNGLCIMSRMNRKNRVSPETIADVPTDIPLILFHLGHDHSVNLVSKESKDPLSAVYDITVGNLAVLTIYPETRKIYNISFPAEAASAADGEDYHLVLIPVIDRFTHNLSFLTTADEDVVSCVKSPATESGDNDGSKSSLDNTVIEVPEPSLGKSLVDRQEDISPDISTDLQPFPEKSSIEMVSEQPNLDKSVVEATDLSTVDSQNQISRETEIDGGSAPENIAPGSQNNNPPSVEKSPVEPVQLQSDMATIPSTGGSANQKKTHVEKSPMEPVQALSETVNIPLTGGSANQEETHVEKSPMKPVQLQSDMVIIPSPGGSANQEEIHAAPDNLVVQKQDERPPKETPCEDLSTSFIEKHRYEVPQIHAENRVSELRIPPKHANKPGQVPEIVSDQDSKVELNEVDETQDHPVPKSDTTPIRHQDPAHEDSQNHLDSMPKNHPEANVMLDKDTVKQQSLERNFIQESIYEEIITKLPSVTCKNWAKECDVPRCGTAADVKKLILQRIKSVINHDASLSPTFIGKLVGKMNDSAITVELFNFNIIKKNDARARKTQLVNYLCSRYSNINLKDMQTTFKHEKSMLNQSVSKRSKKKRAPKKKPPKNNNSGPDQPEQVAPGIDHEVHADNKKGTAEKNDFPESAVSQPAAIEEVEISSRPKELHKKEATGTPCCEIPMKTMERSILDLRRSLSSHEDKLELTIKQFTKVTPQPVQYHKISQDQTDLLKRMDDVEAQNNSLMELFRQNQDQLLDLRKTIDTQVIPAVQSKPPVESKKEIQPQSEDIQHLKETNELQAERISHLEGENCELKLLVKMMEERIEDKNTVIDSLQHCLATVETIVNRPVNTANATEAVPPQIPTKAAYAIGRTNCPEPNEVARPQDSAATRTVQTNIAIQVNRSESKTTKATGAIHKKEPSAGPSHQGSQVDLGDDEVQIIEPVNSPVAENANSTAIANKESVQNKKKPSNKCPANKERTVANIKEVPEHSQNTSSAVKQKVNTAATKAGRQPEKHNIDDRSESKPLRDENYSHGNRQNHVSRAKIQNQNRNRTCLLVHDGSFDGFNPSWLRINSTITEYNAKSIEIMLRTGNIVSKIKAQKPDMVYLHVGHRDLWRERDPRDVINTAKQLIWKILENTDTRLCMSLVIPTKPFASQYSRISKYNELLEMFIDSVRENHKYRARIFTQHNDRVAGHIKRVVGERAGFEAEVTPEGQRILFLRLKDGVHRTLGYTQGYTSGNRHNDD